MRNIVSSGVGLLVILFVVSGCSGGVDGPVIEGNQRNSGTTAEVFGEVVIEAECLYLSWTEPETRFPVIWPHGTAWDSEQSAVVLPGGTLVHEGDEVYGGGGYHHEENLSEFTSQEGVDLALSCVDNTYGEVAVFNSGDTVEIRG